MTESLEGHKKAKTFNTDFLQPITYAPVDLTKVTQQSQSICFQLARHKTMIAITFLVVIAITISLTIFFVNTDEASKPLQPFSKSYFFFLGWILDT